MKMEDYINDFTNHLKDAITIGESTSLKLNIGKILKCINLRAWGSGIGGTIISDIF